MITIGIDIGTTHTKVLALDAIAGRTLAAEVAPTPAVRDTRGDSRRADDVLETVVSLIARAVRSVDVPSQVRAVSAASVGEEAVLLDEGRRPVEDVIAWFDPRGVEQAAAFASGAGGDLALSHRWPPDPSFSLFKLLWMRAYRAGTCGGLHPGSILAATSWRARWRSGDGLDPCITGRRLRPGGSSLGRGHDPRGRPGLPGLPAPRPLKRTILGTLSRPTADRTGLSDGVAIVAGGHDHLCAAYAAGLRSTAELFVSAGTSEAHLALVHAPDEGRDGHLSIDQGCYVDTGTYYVHLPVPSGTVFQQWRSLLYGDSDEETIFAEVADGARGRWDHLRAAR